MCPIYRYYRYFYKKTLVFNEKLCNFHQKTKFEQKILFRKNSNFFLFKKFTNIFRNFRYFHISIHYFIQFHNFPHFPLIFHSFTTHFSNNFTKFQKNSFVYIFKKFYNSPKKTEKIRVGHEKKSIKGGAQRIFFQFVAGFWRVNMEEKKFKNCEDRSSGGRIEGDQFFEGNFFFVFFFQFFFVIFFHFVIFS